MKKQSTSKRTNTPQFQTALSAVTLLCILLLNASCAGPEGAVGPIGPDGLQGPAGADGQNFKNYSEDFSSFGIAAPLSTSGNAIWFATSDLHFGNGLDQQDNSKVQSGDIDDSESSDLNLAVDMPHSGVCTFEVSIDSEPHFDYLNWYIDGTLVNGISGYGGPFVYYFNVPSGAHTITFAYEKDDSDSSEEDAARLDNIQVTNFAVDGRGAYPQPVLPSTTFLRSNRPAGLSK